MLRTVSREDNTDENRTECVIWGKQLDIPENRYKIEVLGNQVSDPVLVSNRMSVELLNRKVKKNSQGHSRLNLEATHMVVI